MNITAFNKGGTIHFHKAGCQDLARGANRYWAQDSQDFSNLDTAIDNYLDTGDESNPGFIMEEMEIFPCAGK